MSPRTAFIAAAVAATAAIAPAGAAASPDVSAARACSRAGLGNEFTEVRAHGMTCRAARRAIKRGRFSGGFRYRFVTRGFGCRRVTGNYTAGLYKCRDEGRVFRFRYRHPEEPNAGDDDNN